MVTLFYICFYIWFIYGLFGLASNLSLNIQDQTELIAHYRSIANVMFTIFTLTGVFFLFSAIRLKKSRQKRKLEQSLVHLLLANRYELPMAEFIFLNKETSKEASEFVEQRIKDFPKNPKSRGKLVLNNNGNIRYYFYDKRGHILNLGQGKTNSNTSSKRRK